VIENTCVNCHMEKSLPPAALSNNFGGTNHTFFAKAGICTSCHTSVNGENLAEGFQSMFDTLKGAIEARIVTVLGDQIKAGYTIRLKDTNTAGSTIAVIGNMSSVAKLEIASGTPG
jgi:hypothetical protein